MGDSSDNIPGVAGIGKKTAASLISNFVTLEGIYESIDDKRISKGVREKLLNDRENAFLSRTLAKINTEVPLGITLENLERKEIDTVGLYKKFAELELHSLIAKFGLSAAKTPESESTHDGKEASNDDITIKKIEADKLNKIDTKRIYLEILNSIVYIFADNKRFSYDGPLQSIANFFRKKEIVCHDGKSLWHTLDKSGIDLSDTVFLDLGLYAYVLNPGSGASSPAALTAMFTGKAATPDSTSVHLFPETEEKMRESVIANGLDKILFDIEIPLLPVLAKIEKAGFKISPDKMREFADALDALAKELTGRIYMQAGHEFNVNSPKQLGEVLFEEMGLTSKKKKNKTGYSTDAETLEELRREAPIVEDILEYRQVTKLAGTYASVFPTLADENDRIHTDFKQALTATGRLSSADPNLQNVPIRTKMGREMRRYFVADEGYTLVDADYSQIELRILAHVSDDYTMKDAFISGEDIHRKTAAAVFGLPEEMVTEEMRKRAKAVNFGIVYGIGGFSLAKDIGTSVAEATRYIKNYMMNYPSIEEYLDTVVERAILDGYTTTVFGRRRYIPELTSQNGNMRAFGKRVAMNAPIQGTAADIMKMAMLAVDRRLEKEGLDARIVMQVHDELVVEVKDEQAELCARLVKEEMEGVAKLSIPLTVDVTTGKNWLEQE